MGRVAAGILVAVTGMLAFAAPASAAEVWLRVGTLTKTMPDGVPVAMWGYAIDTDRDFSTVDGDSPLMSPGPRIDVPPGDSSLVIHLYNGLSEPTSLIIPGLIAQMQPVWLDGATVISGARPAGNRTARVRSLTAETPPGGSAVYTWSAVKPGTYLYESATHQAVQVQMGLYGAVTNDADAGLAYAGVAYQSDVVLLYSEVDPALHEAVDTGAYGTTITSTIDYAPKYFLVNGAPYSVGAPDLPAAAAGQRTLLRILNAGLQSHVPIVQGSYMSIVAEDGNPYPYARVQYSALLPAGKTLDAIIEPATSGRYAVFDRRLFVHNAGAGPGGQLTFLAVGE